MKSPTVTKKCLDQGSGNVVTFLWGIEGEYQEVKNYMFKTQIEAEAFRLALSECRDWAALRWAFAVKEISYD